MTFRITFRSRHMKISPKGRAMRNRDRDTDNLNR